jgi:hypothetical protein
VPVLAFAAESKSLQLSSTLSFFATGDGKEGLVSLNSEVEALGPSTFRYTYRITNEAPFPVHVTWGIISSATEIRDIRNDLILSARAPLNIVPDRPTVFQVTSSERPKWGIGDVVVKSVSGEVLTRGIASSYGPLTASLWEIGAR